MKKIPKRIWIKIAKIAGIIVGIYLLIIIAISIYIGSSKKRLVKTITDKAEQSLLGKLTIDQADIGVWQSFPKIALALNNIIISDSVFHLPVIKAKTIEVKIGLFDLLSNNVKVNMIKVEDATVHIFTRRDGYTNSYVFKSKNKTAPDSNRAKKPVVISNLKFDNVTLISENAIKNKRYEVRFKRMDADIKLVNGAYHIQVKEDALIRGLGFNMAKGYWLENQTVSAKWKMQFDTAKKTLHIDETDVAISGQPFVIGATFFLLPGAAAHFRLDAKTKQIHYNKALAILKPTTRAKISKIDIKKPLDVNITLDGPLAYRTTPWVKASWQAKNNSIAMPGVNLDSVTFNGSFNNHANDSLPFGDENTNVYFNLFTAKLGGITLTAKEISMTNLVVPNLHCAFYSTATLPQLNNVLNSERATFTKGNALLYILYDGPIANDPALLSHLTAKIKLTDGEVFYTPTAITLSQCNGTITVYNNNLYINNLTANLNKSKITVNVKGTNLSRLSEGEEGKALIQCNVTSPFIDLTSLKKIFSEGSGKPKAAKKSNKSVSTQVDEALENGTMMFNMNINEVVLNRFKATSVITSMTFKKSNFEMHKVYLKSAGGTLNMTGTVRRSSASSSTANVNLNVSSMNISQVFYSFNNFGMQSLTFKNIRGMLNLKSNLSFLIDNNGNALPGTTNGSIDLSVKKGALIRFEPIKSIQSFALKNRDLNNIEFEELKDRFEIHNGDIYISRMPVQSTAFLIFVEGVYSLKEQTNIAIQVPIKTIFKSPDYDKTAVSTDKGGPSIWLRAKTDNDGKVKVGLDVFKKLRSDKYENVIFDSTNTNNRKNKKGRKLFKL